MILNAPASPWTGRHAITTTACVCGLLLVFATAVSVAADAPSPPAPSAKVSVPDTTGAANPTDRPEPMELTEADSRKGPPIYQGYGAFGMRLGRGGCCHETKDGRLYCH
jgi:hypothetical protein